MTTDVWLPFAPEEIPGLPSAADHGLTYRFWDGGDTFPADPADCAFYVVPYLKGAEIAVRPLAGMARAEVVQTLSAASTTSRPGWRSSTPACACATRAPSTRRAPPSWPSP
ncbi:hypothetical protein ACFQVA_30860 [Actinomadura keratinilytica]